MEKLFGRLTVLALVLGLTASIADAADITSGLLGHWPLDGDAEDSVGDANGELVGGADWVQNGRVDGAVKFDGSSGYVEISGFELITDTVTYVAWINGWRQSAWTGIISLRGGANDSWMGFTDQDTLSYVWNADSDQTWGWRNGPTIPENEWAMVAVAIEPDKATSYIYTDAGGLQQEVNGISHIEQSVANLKIGWDSCCGADRHFMGIIDEVMIYDRALTEDDILKLATSGLAVLDAADKLTATWGSIKAQD